MLLVMDDGLLIPRRVRSTITAMIHLSGSSFFARIDYSTLIPWTQELSLHTHPTHQSRDCLGNASTWPKIDVIRSEQGHGSPIHLIGNYFQSHCPNAMLQATAGRSQFRGSLTLNHKELGRTGLITITKNIMYTKHGRLRLQCVSVCVWQIVCLRVFCCCVYKTADLCFYCDLIRISELKGVISGCNYPLISLIYLLPSVSFWSWLD